MLSRAKKRRLTTAYRVLTAIVIAWSIVLLTGGDFFFEVASSDMSRTITVWPRGLAAMWPSGNSTLSNSVSGVAAHDPHQYPGAHFGKGWSPSLGWMPRVERLPNVGLSMLIVPFWPLLIALMISIAILMWLCRGRPQNKNDSHCSECGYDLRGSSASAKCPECGAIRQTVN